VLEAIRIGEIHAPRAVLEATGEDLTEILAALIPGLLLCLCVLAGTTAVGTAGGAALGAVAAGVGALPGVALGAGLGLEAGLALLEILGLAFLAAVIGGSLLDATGMAAGAVNEAWHAIDDPRSRRFHIEHAGTTLAAALGVLMRGVLQGTVAFLLANGVSQAASRVPELVARLRASRFGETFATWVESHWPALLRNERLQPPRSTGPGESGQPSTSPSASSWSRGGAASQRPSSSAPKQEISTAPETAAAPARTVPTGELGGVPTGKPARILEQDDAETRRSHTRENECAVLLARKGYRVEQKPVVEGANPDYRIEGRLFDCKAPSGPRPRNAASEIEKSVKHQAARTILCMDDAKFTLADMKAQLTQYPIEGLEEVIAIKGGEIIPLWP
jgi:hypothetical protein